MALPWHIPLECAPVLKRKPEVLQPSLLKHYSNLKVNDTPIEELQTGLMCDIGTSNKETSTIQRLIASGMTVARINIRDMEPDVCAQIIQSIRQAVYNYSAELEYVYPLAIIVDVKGPDIVTGNLKGGPQSIIELMQNASVRLTNDINWRENGTSDCIFVGYEYLTDLDRGDFIYIDSLTPGNIKLVVSNVGDDCLECEVADGGTIGPKMTVRINHGPKEVENTSKRESKTELSCYEVSKQSFEYMEDQISWAIASDVDAVLVSNAQVSNDITRVKELLLEKGQHILVFSCIDTVMGLDNIDELLHVSDGIYFDRCVLSTDLPVEKIFIATKIILSKCNDVGKPCICKAVINETIPTLCVTDIANLIIDGADVLALELHYDSPLMKVTPTYYDAIRMAEQCLAATSVICRHAEHITWQPRIYGNMELMQSPLEEPTKAVCVSAVELAMRSRAVVIICLTNSGRTAKILSHAKPACPIVAVTRACHTGRQMRFWRSVRAMHYFEVPKDTWALEVESRIHAALDYCKAKRILRAGDPYVIVTGSRKGVGYCDSVRLLYASSRDTVLFDM